MTFELILLIVQTVSLFFLAAWLSTGVFENIRFPDLNRTFTSEVLDFTRMREEYPDAYAQVAYRRISNPTIQRALFCVVVLWETVAVIALWIGTVALCLACLGHMDADQARGWGLLGALLFTATWAGFLVVGNWFCYWFCHEGAQNTHFQMTLWGMSVLILLAVG